MAKNELGTPKNAFLVKEPYHKQKLFSTKDEGKASQKKPQNQGSYLYNHNEYITLEC